ncbi:uncharacterized protein LOC131221824 [Magnolia sinica]|uniref:uncharacterized protein LOC131221824 n=1 Tax=Magnolia sinica TaxID=86752 RepID=UPI00265A1E26|nr:uncharacterized protein LOC131221824 [Magnolia sinica]
MNKELFKLVSIEEVRQAVFSIPADSAPGPDGFGGAFFTSYWDIIQADLFVASLDFFSGGKIPRAIQCTLITLIPKKKDPESLADYRPISLCNCIMKIFSKIMASRLALILPHLISKEQSAFTHGRSIIENITLAREMALNLDRKVFGGNLIIKVDMEKAYDRLEWGSSSRLSNVHMLLRFITQYENASGQKMNIAKTSFIVPKNYTRTKVQKLSTITGYKQALLPSMYLGVPLSKGRIPAPQLHQLVQRIIRRIDGWKAKLLNQAAKLVLIKHVLSSIPIRMLAAINIPKSVSKSINRAMANFFWGSSEKGNKRHWVNWQSVCTPVLEGGLGIRTFEDISRVIRIKMGWQLLQGGSLWAKFTSTRYFRKFIASNGVNGQLSSSSWNEIFQSPAVYYQPLQMADQGREFQPVAPELVRPRLVNRRHR